MFKKLSPYRQFGILLILFIFLCLLIELVATLKLTYSPSSHAPIAVQRLREFYGDPLSDFNIAFHVTNELIMSPFTPKILIIILVSMISFMFVIFIGSFIYLIKHRKQYTPIKNMLFVVLNISLIFFWLFGLVFTPIFTEFMLIQLSKAKIENVLGSTTSLAHETDPSEIIVLLEKTKEPTLVIVGYGVAGNAYPQLADLTFKTYYDTFVLPSALYTFKNTVNFNNDSWSTSPIWYFPEKNILVITDISKVHEIMQPIIYDMLEDRNLGELKLMGGGEAPPADINILKDSEYSNYLIQKVKDIKQADLQTLKADLANNTLVLEECSRVIDENEQTYKNEQKDYQLNCVNRKNYSNCQEFEASLQDFEIEMKNIESSCTAQTELATQYNREISQLMEKVEVDIKSYDDINSLDRKIAELSAGIFIQPNNIYIRDTSDQAELFRILIHELVHYAVYNDARTLPTFLDEGLTDYVTSKSVGFDDYYTVAVSPYFVELQVVQALMERMPENELIPVFKSGDETKFKELFERYFAGSSYDTFVKRGEEIFRTSYEVNDKEFIYDAKEFRSYIGLPVIQDMRDFLGLDIEYDYRQ